MKKYNFAVYLKLTQYRKSTTLQFGAGGRGDFSYKTEQLPLGSKRGKDPKNNRLVENYGLLMHWFSIK